MSRLRRTHLLDEIEEAFAQTSVVEPPILDGERSLSEARAIVLDRTADLNVKDRVWRELVRNARTNGPDAQLAALWMMSPGLRKIATRWSRSPGIDLRDIEAEAVLGFLMALRTVNIEREGIAAALWWRAYDHAARAATSLTKEMPVEDIDLVSPSSRGASGIPDSPLEDAVYAGVITISEADLINKTRLEGERLGSVAERMGLKYHACRQRRARAEGRLAGYLLIDGDDTAPKELRQRKARPGCAQNDDGAAA